MKADVTSLRERYWHRGLEQKRRSSLCFIYSQDGITIKLQPEHIIYSYNDGYTSSLLTATQALSSLTLGIVEGPCYVLPAGLAVGCFELSSSLRVTRAFLARYAALFFTMACMSLGLCEYCFHPEASCQRYRRRRRRRCLCWGEGPEQ